MGGKVYDRTAMVPDRDPNRQLAVEVGKFEKPTPIDMGAAFARALVDYGLEALKKVTGIDLERLAVWLGPLNFLDEDFDPIDAAYSFIEDVLLPAGLLAPAAMLQGAIDFIINALTGGNHVGHPIEMLRDALAGVGRGISTAIESANQATNNAREMMEYVIRTVSEAPGAIVDDIAEGIQGFAFWFLSMFGVTKQSVSDENPVFAKLEGRVAVIEANVETGSAGWNDHFNRPDIGTDWVAISPRGNLQIQNSKYIKSYASRAGRHNGPIILLTDTWHVQATLAAMDYGNSRIYYGTNGDNTDASFTKGLCLDFSFQSFGFRVTMYTMAGGLLSGMTERQAEEWDVGVVKNNDVFSVERIPDDPTSPTPIYTFYVYRNNVEVPSLTWTDVNGVVPAGPDFRKVAILTNTVNNAQFSGPGFDDVSAYDIKAN